MPTNHSRRAVPTCVRALCAACLTFAALLANAAADSRPNVVVIVADDLGYADVSAYGGDRIATPNIDRLGRQGVTFTNGYVTSPVCGPSRAGLMTGRYPQRFGFEFNNGPANRDITDNLGLPKSEITLGAALQNAGYHTGIVGKWHLGANADYYPTSRGFDEFFGILPGATAYIDPRLPGVHNFVRPGEAQSLPTSRVESAAVITGPDRKRVDNFDKYLTDEFSDQAVQFIERSKREPFFLYLAFNAPHDPLQVTQKYYDRFPHIDEPMQRIYAGMVSAMDDGVGRVLQALDDAGIADNTLVIFISDNGCAAYYPNLCACEPLRGGKLTHFEGGVRVPFMVRWPAKVPAEQRIDAPVSSLDIFPTAMAAAAAALPSDRAYDGIDLTPHLMAKTAPNAAAGAPQQSAALDRNLFWWRAPLRSVRSGDWKLWASETGSVRLLYNLVEDPNERTNLYALRPDKVKELETLLSTWHADKAKPLWESRPHTRYDACGMDVEVPI